MAGLSLKVLLELQKKGFERNIASVKNGLNSLKKTVMGITSAFVGGLGLTELVGRFTQTAKELSQVEATLRNVSDGYLDYAENMQFLRSVAQQYGQEQNALIGSFAKFSSAAKGAGMELATQQRIFRSLTKAAGAFRLTADQTSAVMLAVEQMISKGVVASEELRRQLSNVLPGSFQAMANAAQAAGIIATNSQEALMDAMKQGQVVASEVLPYFANELDKITSNASFDSLVSSVNRLSNAWTQFVKNSQFTGFYQSMVDGLASALDGLGKHFKNFLILIGSSAIGVAFKKIYDSSFGIIDNLNTKLEATKAEIEDNRASLISMQKELASLQTGQVDKLTKSFTLAEAEAARLSEGIRNLALDNKKYKKDLTTATLNAADAQNLLNYRITEGTANIKADRKEKRNLEKEIDKSATSLGKMALGLQGTLKTIVGFFASILKYAKFVAIAYGIGKVVDGLKSWYNWQKKINDLENNSVPNAQKLSPDAQAEIDKAEALLRIYEDTDMTFLGKKQALQEINALLGLTDEEMLKVGASAEEVRQKIEGWKKVKSADTVSQQMRDAVEKASMSITELKRRLIEITSDPNYGKMGTFFDEAGASMNILTIRAVKLALEAAKITREIKAQEKAYKDLIAVAGVTEDDPEFIGPPRPSILSGKKTEEQTAVSNAIDEYNRTATELENKYKNGILTSKQYQKELANEKYKVLQSIGIYQDLEKIIDSLPGNYRKYYNEIKAGAKQAGGEETNPVKDAIDKYIKTEGELDNLLKNGIIDQQTYNERLIEAAEACEEVVGSQEDMYGTLEKLKGSYREWFDMMQISKQIAKDEVESNKKMDESLENLIKQMEEAKENKKKYQEAVKDLGDIPVFDPSRDTSLDYKKDGSEILDDNAEKIEDFVKTLTDYKKGLEKIKKEYGYLSAEEQNALTIVEKLLKQAGDGATTARAKASIAEINEDIKDLKKEIADTKWDTITQSISGFEGIVSSIESCIDAFEKLDEADATWIDHLKAGFTVIDSLVSLMESVKSITEAVKNVQELSSRLQEAQAQRQILLSKIKADQTIKEGQASMQAAADKSVAAGIEIAADKAKSKEAAKAAVGKAAESVAGTPFVGPWHAIAAITSVVGVLLAAFSKFATGGIVGGSKTHGDQNVIRADAGEMVLNKAQQGNLFNLIKNGGTGGQVEFVLRGDRLVGAIRNYESRIRG